MRLWDAKKFRFRESKAVSRNEPEIAVVETPDGDLTVVEGDETPKSEGQLIGQHDSTDSEGSEESDEELS